MCVMSAPKKKPEEKDRDSEMEVDADRGMPVFVCVRVCVPALFACLDVCGHVG